MGGFVSKPSTPSVQTVETPAAPTVEETTPVPTKAPTKAVSAGAQAAAEAQRDRAKKNRGLAASILTNRSGLAQGAQDLRNDTLG